MNDEWLVAPLSGMGPMKFGNSVEMCLASKELYGGETHYRASIYEEQVKLPSQEDLAELQLIMPDTDWNAHFAMMREGHVMSYLDDVKSWQFSDGPTLAFYNDKLIEITCDPGDTRPWLEDIDLFTRPPRETLVEMIQLYGAPMYDGGDGLYWVQSRLLLTGFVHGVTGDAPLFGPRSNGPEDKPSVRIDSPDMPDFDTIIKEYDIPFAM